MLPLQVLGDRPGQTEGTAILLHCYLLESDCTPRNRVLVPSDQILTISVGWFRVLRVEDLWVMADFWELMQAMPEKDDQIQLAPVINNSYTYITKFEIYQLTLLQIEKKTHN